MTQIDYDARYRVDGWPGVAVYIRGPVTYQPECEGHPDDGILDGPIGETFYCDGSCRGEEATSLLRVVMVGDDREHEVDIDDLIKLDDLDYCAQCGQIGCGHDGRDRD